MACATCSGGSTWLRGGVLLGIAFGAALLHKSLSEPISTEFVGTGVVIPGAERTVERESAATELATTPAVATPTVATPTVPTTQANLERPALGASNDAGGQTMVSTDNAVALFNDLQTQFVDAREPEEFGVGRIPSAVSLPVSAFNGQNIEATEAKIALYLRRDLNVVVYCGGGDCDASKLVAKQLQSRMFPKIAVYHDGMTGWSAAGLPSEVGPENPPGLPRSPIMPPTKLPGGQP